MPRSYITPGGVRKRKLRSVSPVSKHISSASDKRPRFASESVDHRRLLCYEDEHEEGEVLDASSQAEAVDTRDVDGIPLQLSNLAYATTEQDLKAFFEGYCVKDICLPINPLTKCGVGYCFLHIFPRSVAQRAIRELNGKIMLGREIAIQLASSEQFKNQHDNLERPEHENVFSNADVHSSIFLSQINSLVNILIEADSDTLLFSHSLRNLVDACHSPAPGEVALGNIVELFRAKGIDQAKISELLTHMQPLWSKRVASYLATLISEPAILKEILNILFDGIESQQNGLHVPFHIREAMQAMLGGLTASSGPSNHDPWSMTSYRGGHDTQSVAAAMRRPTPSRQFLNEVVSTHLRQGEVGYSKSHQFHTRTAIKVENDARNSSFNSQLVTSENKLEEFNPCPTHRLSAHPIVGQDGGTIVTKQGTALDPTVPKHHSDPSKLAMIIIHTLVPAYGSEDIIHYCRESLGATVGIEQAYCMSSTTWVLYFKSALAAVSAIGRNVRIRREVVVVRPVLSHILDPSIHDSTPYDASAPRIFMSVFQNGPPSVDEVEVLRGIANHFPKLTFSLQGQRRPIGNNTGTTTKHVKWILAFDSPPGVAKFRIPVTIRTPGGTRQPFSVHWLPVSKAHHCVVCRQGHAPVDCPHLYRFWCPKEVKLAQYAPHLR